MRAAPGLTVGGYDGVFFVVRDGHGQPNRASTEALGDGVAVTLVMRHGWCTFFQKSFYFNGFRINAEAQVAIRHGAAAGQDAIKAGQQNA